MLRSQALLWQNRTGSAQLDLIGGTEKGIMSTIWLHSLTDIIPLTTKPHLMTFEILSTWSVVSALYVFIFQPITQFRCWFTNSQWRWFGIHIGLLINHCTEFELVHFFLHDCSQSRFCPLVYHLQLNLQSAYVLSIVSRNYLTISCLWESSAQVCCQGPKTSLTCFISIWFESCDWFVMINLQINKCWAPASHTRHQNASKSAEVDSCFRLSVELYSVPLRMGAGCNVFCLFLVVRQGER